MCFSILDTHWFNIPQASHFKRIFMHCKWRIVRALALPILTVWFTSITLPNTHPLCATRFGRPHHVRSIAPRRTAFWSYSSAVPFRQRYSFRGFVFHLCSTTHILHSYSHLFCTSFVMFVPAFVRAFTRQFQQINKILRRRWCAFFAFFPFLSSLRCLLLVCDRFNKLSDWLEFHWNKSGTAKSHPHCVCVYVYKMPLQSEIAYHRYQWIPNERTIQSSFVSLISHIVDIHGRRSTFTEIASMN